MPSTMPRDPAYDAAIARAVAAFAGILKDVRKVLRLMPSCWPWCCAVRSSVVRSIRRFSAGAAQV